MRVAPQRDRHLLGRGRLRAGDTTGRREADSYHHRVQIYVRPAERRLSPLLGSQLGGRATPPAGETFVAISGGFQQTCGLRQDGTPVCWGDNEGGEATPPRTGRNSSPLAAAPDTPAVCMATAPPSAGAATGSGKRHRRVRREGSSPSRPSCDNVGGGTLDTPVAAETPVSPGRRNWPSGLLGVCPIFNDGNAYRR